MQKLFIIVYILGSLPEIIEADTFFDGRCDAVGSAMVKLNNETSEDMKMHYVCLKGA
jgi:hypothetical protein